MVGISLSARDLLLPIVTAVAGYVVGILQSVAADRRDRSKARNRVLYLLFQIRREVRVTNPREFLPIIANAVVKRVDAIPGELPDEKQVAALLSVLLEALSGQRRSRLTESYEAAVEDLVSTDPLLALRLTGPHIARLDAAVKEYYRRVQAQPEVIANPTAARVLASMETHALELALKESLEQLAVDIRELAASYLPIKRRRILRLLASQAAASAEGVIEAELGPVLDEIVERIKAQMTTSPTAA